MNTDILKGKWLEIKGRIKERWGTLTDNDLGEIEGRSERLLGLLQKKYGYIRDKAGLEYNDSVELAEIVSSIRDVMTKRKDVRAIAFIALRTAFVSQETRKSNKGGKIWVRYCW